MHPKHETWRVRGVPQWFDEATLTDVLLNHPDLRVANEGTTNGEDNNVNENGVSIRTLAPSLTPRSDQVATIRFRQVPTQLAKLGLGSQLTIDLPTEKSGPSIKSKRARPQAVRVAIDRHFNDITILYTPPDEEYRIDILAVSGLGSHPYGSFAHKDDGHMWLSDTLPEDMPMARVMIYGYGSSLPGSTSFASLDDLAGSLQLAICRLLRSKRKPLALIGHSLGGLIIQEALIRIAESDSDADLIDLIFGALFFGVPNEGIDIDSLIPMVNDQPNRALLESLSATNSQILAFQRRNFSKVVNQTNLEIFCFFETRFSPTAAKDSSGQYKMNGPAKCLVTPASATRCLPQGVSSEHSVPIDRTHSDLVKFASHDHEYENVSYVFRQMYQRYTRPEDLHESPSNSGPNQPPLALPEQDPGLVPSTASANDSNVLSTPSNYSQDPPNLTSPAAISGKQRNPIVVQYLQSPIAPRKFQHVQTLLHTTDLRSVAFSPDSHKLASGSKDETILIWQADSLGHFQQIQVLKGHKGRINSVAFSADGHQLASTSLYISNSLFSNAYSSEIFIWQADPQGLFQQFQESRSHKDMGWINPILFSPDNRYLASGSEHKLAIWQANSQGRFQPIQEPQGHGGYIHAIAFSPDGHQLASSSKNKIYIWQIDSQGQFQQIQAFKGHKYMVNSLAFSPDGQHLASGSEDKTVRIWQATPQGQFHQVQELRGFGSGAQSVAFSPDGHQLASGSEEGKVHLFWRTHPQGQFQQIEVLEGHTTLVRSVAFSPDGHRLASASFDNTIRIWGAY